MQKNIKFQFEVLDCIFTQSIIRNLTPTVDTGSNALENRGLLHQGSHSLVHSWRVNQVTLKWMDIAAQLKSKAQTASQA